MGLTRVAGLTEEEGGRGCCMFKHSKLVTEEGESAAAVNGAEGDEHRST